MFKQIAIALSLVLTLACGGVGSDSNTTQIHVPDPTPISIPDPVTPVANSVNFDMKWKLDPSYTIGFENKLKTSASMSDTYHLPQSYIDSNPSLKNHFYWDLYLTHNGNNSELSNPPTLDTPTVEYITFENTGSIDLSVTNFYSSNFDYAISAGYSEPTTITIKSGQSCDLIICDWWSNQESHTFRGSFLITVKPVLNGDWDIKFPSRDSDGTLSIYTTIQ
jgi:hypothetical protein